MRIYLSPPGLLCCAGTDRDQVFDAALCGDQGGIVPVCLFGEKTFPVGRIDGELPMVGPSAADTAFATAYTTDTRLLRIADAALEQIRPYVEQAIITYGKSRIA
ncbi:MAG: hypothetical protein LBN21_03510, partial [Treponema sp.]|nr:hypothetical protein [Treponema sp.]